MAKTKTKKQQTMGFAPTVEDLKLVAELKIRFQPTMGIPSTATLLRMGLRKLAEAEGLR